MIHLHIPSLPPSSNHAYVTVRSARMLSSNGKKYKKETAAWITQHYPRELAALRHNQPFWAVYIFNTPNLFNKGFDAGKAENQYKKLDASNRVKLLEDVIVEVTGIDDSCCLGFMAIKREAPKEETHCYIWVTDEEGTNPFGQMIQFHTSQLEE